MAILGSTDKFLGVRGAEIARGRFLSRRESERAAQVAVLGSKVDAELFGSDSALGRIVRVGDWRFRVIGVLGEGGVRTGLDMDDLVIIPVETAMRLFDRTSLFRVVLSTVSHDRNGSVCPQVESIIEERHGENDVTCFTQESVVETLFDILDTLTAALAGIAGVSLAVAGVGIMNVMLVSVSERRSEIGLARALGARPRQVLGIFLAESVVLAGLGGLGGLAVGFGAVQVVGWIYPAFPVAVPLWAAGAALVNALAVGALFGWLPARRATRLDPIAALAGH